MINQYKKYLAYFKTKRWLWLVLIILLILGAIYFYTNKNDDTSFEFVTVKKQDLIQEVNVTGQVKPSVDIDLAFEKTGPVKRILVKGGQSVATGDLLAQLDINDALKNIRDAEVALELAQLDLAKKKLAQSQQLRGDVLNKNYEDGLVILADFYNGLGDMVDDLDSIFFDIDLSERRKSNIQYYSDYDDKFKNIPVRAEQLFAEIEKAYPENLSLYQLASRGSGDIRQQAIEGGYALTVKLAELIKIGNDVVGNLNNVVLGPGSTHSKQSIIDEHQADLESYANKI